MNLDAVKWPVVAVASVSYLIWQHTTGASETTKRLVGVAWVMFWVTIPWVATGTQLDPLAVLIGAAFIIGGAIVRSTPAVRYYTAFLGAFLGVMLLLFITDCVLHPNSWCPSPMYINAQGICRQP